MKQIQRYFKRILLSLLALMATAMGTKADDMTATPLTFEAVEAGTINIVNPNLLTIEFSKDGATWTAASSNPISIPVAAGDQVRFRGDNPAYGMLAPDEWAFKEQYTRFTATNDVYIYGNVMSLISSTGYPTLTTLPIVGGDEEWDMDINLAFLFTTPVSEDDWAPKDNTTIKNHPTKDIVLPAMNVTRSGYMYMFSGCQGLTRAPELPATDLGWGCYHQMFSNCINLERAPELPAASVPSEGYSWMFNGCTKLNYVKCLATDISIEGCTGGWLTGVAATGTFVKAAGMNDWTVGPQGEWNEVDGIPEGWTVEEASEATDMAGEPLTFEAVEAGTITVKYDYYGDAPSGYIQPIQYKLNDGSWTEVTWDEDIALAANDVISFRGDNPSCYDSENWEHYYFVCSNDCYVYGNVMSLLHSTTFATETTLTDEYCFSDLFCNQWEPNTTIKNHPTKDIVLPATTLTDYCYNSMFNGCTGLTRAPELPAKVMTAYCYNDMFNGCTSLTAAPALPATTLAEGCYTFMFWGCTALTSAPALPATTLANMCYDGIFMNCENLATAPVLPAPILAEGCYSEMFMGCTSLTTAPDLLAETLVEGCYSMMFNGCTSLNYVKCLATDISAENSTYGWLTGVPATGTFVLADGTDWSVKVPTTDYDDEIQINGIPGGWTVTTESGTTTYAFTVPASGIGTFSADEAVVVPAGLTAYYCTAFDADASTIAIQAIEGDVIPAATGVLLRGEAGQTFALETTTEAAEAIADNSLVAVTTATHVAATDGDFTNFMLTSGHFVKIQEADANVKMPANKAYLQIPTASIVSVARPITLIWDETTTAIADAERLTMNNERAYDLQGRCLSEFGIRNSSLKKGLYIVNGKKLYIK